MCKSYIVKRMFRGTYVETMCRPMPMSKALEFANELSGQFNSALTEFKISPITDKSLDLLWGGLSDIPFSENKDGDLLSDEPYYIWPIGTDRDDIWHWFDELYSKGLGQAHFQ